MKSGKCFEWIRLSSLCCRGALHNFQLYAMINQYYPSHAGRLVGRAWTLQKVSEAKTALAKLGTKHKKA